MELECLLDCSFDIEFFGRPSLTWLPWVGSHFKTSSTRTVLLGESVYDWGKGFDARYQRTDGLRETHRRHALNYRRDSPYVRNMERAFAKRGPKTCPMVMTVDARSSYFSFAIQARSLVGASGLRLFAIIFPGSFRSAANRRSQLLNWNLCQLRAGVQQERGLPPSPSAAAAAAVARN